MCNDAGGCLAASGTLRGNPLCCGNRIGGAARQVDPVVFALPLRPTGQKVFFPLKARCMQTVLVCRALFGS